MSTSTPTLALVKPDPSAVGDYTDIDVLNSNSDKVDAAILADRGRLTAIETPLVPLALSVPIRVRKTADETRTNTTAGINDAELFFNVVANAEYEIDANIVCIAPNAGGAGGITTFFRFPAISYCVGFFTSTFILGSVGAMDLIDFAQAATVAPANGSATAGVLRLKLYIKPTANGTFNFGFTQFSASATSTTVKAGSFLVARRIA
jgi:hypothetical protein